MPVIVEFESGLGNQLFQFAAGYTLAKKHKTQLIADTSRYNQRSRFQNGSNFRPFNLEDLHFPIDSYRSNPPSRLYSLRGFTRLFDFGKNARLTKHHCPGAHTPVFDRLPDDTLLRGSFQDLSYFREESSDIYTIIKNRLERAAKGKASPLHYNYGAIHMRLGDYLDIPEFYPQWFEKFYHRAVEIMLNTHRCSKVIVFSDEPEKAREILSEFGDKVEFTDCDQTDGGVLDLYRMSTATVLAIANSCFSWWAAYLASQTGSRIIAPRFWSEWCKEPEKLIYPDDWDIHGRSIDDED